MSDDLHPLDDLLPENPACYEPPEDLQDLFACGSPLFDFPGDFRSQEFQDFLVATGLSKKDRELFRRGAAVGVYWTMLRSGVEFNTFAESSVVIHAVATLAARYRRSIQIAPSVLTTSTGEPMFTLTVGASADRLQT